MIAIPSSLLSSERCWRRFAAAIALALSATSAVAQCPIITDSDVTYRAVLPQGPVIFAPNNALLVIMVDQAGVAGVSVPACGILLTNVPVGPGNPLVVDICPGAQHTGTGVLDRRIEVGLSGAPIPLAHVVLKYHHPADNVDDAYLVLPTSRMGTSYRTACYRGAGGLNARFTVIANENGTSVEYKECDGTPGFASPVALNAGQSFQRVCQFINEDCSGLPIVATKPIAVVSGSILSQVPFGTQSEDTLMEMVPPDTWAGSEYLLTEFNKKDTTLGPHPGDLFRIIPIEDIQIDAVQVFIPGGVIRQDATSGRACPDPATLPAPRLAGDWCDYSIGSGTAGNFHGGRIAGTGRFLVVQYAKGVVDTNSGDPTMQVLVPTEHFRCTHRFFSFAGFDFDLADPNEINGSYVNIVALATQIDDVFLDGVALSASCVLTGSTAAEAIPGSAYAWRKCRLRNPCSTLPLPVTCPYGEEHTVEAASGVGVYVYGQRGTGSASGAYSYPAGMAFPN